MFDDCDTETALRFLIDRGIVVNDDLLPVESEAATVQLENRKAVFAYKYKHHSLPAMVFRNSTGQIHRANGPAIVWLDGSRHWCKNNSLHRPDGPAVEEVTGGREWWLEGKRHRIGGPAFDLVCAHRRIRWLYWFENDVLIDKEIVNLDSSSLVDREDFPAIHPSPHRRL